MNFRIIVVCAIMVLVFILGYVLTGCKYPYPALLLTIHKLLPLVLGVMLIVISYRSGLLKGSGGFDRSLFYVFFIFLIISMASGGFISAKSSVPQFVRWLHRGSPYVTTISGLVYYIRVFSGI